MEKKPEATLEKKVRTLTEGRVLARVHAHESRSVVGGHACCHDLTDKGDVSDIDHPPAP